MNIKFRQMRQSNLGVLQDLALPRLSQGAARTRAQGSAHGAVARFPWAFFALAYGFTWLLCLPGVLASRGLFTLPMAAAVALIAVAQCGPSLAAFVLAAHEDGRAGAERLLRRALDWRIPVRWLLPALLLPLALGAAALVVSVATGGTSPELPLLARPLAILPTFLFILLFQGPVPEEFGWRGYALDRLQARLGALGASLVLGVLWAAWHLPLFFTAGYPHSYLPFWAFTVQVVGATVVLTWLYNGSGRKLTVALVFHAAWNLAFALFPPVEPRAGTDLRAFLLLTTAYALLATPIAIRALRARITGR